MSEMNVANMAAYMGSAIAMGLGAIGSGWGIGLCWSWCCPGYSEAAFPEFFAVSGDADWTGSSQ